MAAETCDSSLATGAPATTVLVPVGASGLAGADGSVWETDVWLTNVTDAPVVFPLGPCTVSCCCEEIATRWPQETERLILNYPRGRWFQLPEDRSLQIQARFRDRARSAHSAGIELPLVRQSDFRTDQLNLPGIPTDPGFRTTIRLYALQPNVTLKMEFVDPSGRVFESRLVALEPPEETVVGLIPAYAQVSLPPQTTSEPHFRLRITSSGQGDFWAFASVTNNSTSEVTLITPWW